MTMKKYKKIKSIVLFLVLCILFTGCGAIAESKTDILMNEEKISEDQGFKAEIKEIVSNESYSIESSFKKNAIEPIQEVTPESIELLEILSKPIEESLGEINLSGVAIGSIIAAGEGQIKEAVKESETIKEDEIQQTKQGAPGSIDAQTEEHTIEEIPNHESGELLILNTNTKRIHSPRCADVKKIAAKNYKETYDSIDTWISYGYKICGHCSQRGYL